MILCLVVGCGGGKGGDPQDTAPCTPEGQEVDGTSLTFEVVDLGFTGGSPGATHLITSTEQLAAEFGGSPPMEFDDVDFATDRIVLGASNPVVEFVAESGGDLFAGEEQLCQGVAPSTVGYVVRDVTADVLTVIGCPYTGPDPCLAP